MILISILKSESINKQVYEIIPLKFKYVIKKSKMKNIQYKYLKNSQYSLVYPKQLFAMYSKLFLLILFYSIITIANSEKARYDFYRMYRILPSSENDIKILKEIQNRSDSYKFIKDPIKINEEVLIILAPHKLAEFTDRMKSEEISYELI